MTAPPTVGVFGGSFDPPHAAHVLAVAYAASVTPMSRVWVIPTWKHPFNKPIQAPFKQRLAMCELAFSGLKGVAISDVEREIGETSLTLKTLQEIAGREPQAKLRLIIGADQEQQMGTWHAADRVRELAPPFVVGRAGFESPRGVALPEISSSEIRRRLAAREDTSELLPASVREYIEREELYCG